MLVKIKHKDSHYVKAKALLDNGSQSNFVSNSLVKKLKLNLRDSYIHIEIKGINQQVSNALKIWRSYFESFITKLRCIILTSVTQRVPNIKLDKNLYNIPKNIKLADPQFNIPSEKDLLIGAEKFWDMIWVDQIKLDDGKPVLQKTLLGWIVAGKATSTRNNMCVSYNFNCIQELDETLRKFWQIENIEGSQNVTSENTYCEKHFKETHTRNSQGRFIVKLSVKEGIIKDLESSKEIALKKFLSLEKRLAKDLDLKAEYAKFLKEYENLGHMKSIFAK